MINPERTLAIRSTLAADGYELDVAEDGARIQVTITATDQACSDCLVPKDLMRGILAQALGVPQDSIDLTYPLDIAAPTHPPDLAAPPSLPTSQQGR
jgi:hypothetical protein